MRKEAVPRLALHKLANIFTCSASDLRGQYKMYYTHKGQILLLISPEQQSETVKVLSQVTQSSPCDRVKKRLTR